MLRMWTSLALAFPAIDPVLVHLGPFAIRWYALAYVVGILAGNWYIGRLNQRRTPPAFTPESLENAIVWAILGILLGGRFGYVFFYQWDYYATHPLEIFYIWHGGMSFHGGLLGMLLSFYLFCRHYHLRYLAVMDLIACAAPIGLFLGRIANFINGELYGRASDAPWAMVFPRGGPLPRHPSQLYEALGEGLLLFLLLAYAAHTRALNKEGFLGGLFLAGYSVARLIIEQFREPDEQLGFFFQFFTMGQLLCLPMLLLGIWLMRRATRLATA